MVMLFLVTSTGVNLVKHYCNTSKKEHVQLFSESYKCKTEIEQPKKCCCAKHTSHKENTTKQITKGKCCNDSFQYLKVPFQFDQRLAVNKVILDNCPKIIFNTDISSELTDITDAFQLYHPPPLLLVGNYFIHFTHNLKIPFSSSLC